MKVARTKKKKRIGASWTSTQRWVEKYPYLEWALITQNGLIQLFFSNERSLQWPIYTQLKQLRKENWDNFGLEWRLNPWPLQYQCSAQPTGLSSQLGTDHIVRWSWGLIPVQALNFSGFFLLCHVWRKTKLELLCQLFIYPFCPYIPEFFSGPIFNY